MAGNLPGSLGELERITVDVSSCNPVDAADMVRDQLLKLNVPPWLFSMPPSVVYLAADGTIMPLDPDGWLNLVARMADFMTISAKGQARLVAPPTAVMRLVPAAVMPELPVLDGVASLPYFDSEGTLVSVDGYHPGTRLLLRTGGLAIPHVASMPPGEAVEAARRFLVTEWLGDFPFAGPADRAAAIAVLLTLTGRMFFSLAPLFVFDASTSGAGKGLLTSTTSVIATGDVPQIMELPADGEEQRKKITTAVLGGRDLLVWDEMHVIAGRSLAAVLTAERYADRLLGARPSAARRPRPGRPRTWSRPWRTASARSSARSPWTRNPMRSPQSGSC
jgi:hypothetical protein